MKMKTLEPLRNFQHRLNRSRRWLFVVVITLLFIPSSTRADGIKDILSLFHTITSTLQGPIGGALSEMRKVSAAVNKFRQEIIWPLALINQTRSFVSATRGRYTGLMSQIEGLKNNSATLALPCSWSRCSVAPNLGQSARFPRYTRRSTSRLRWRELPNRGSATSWTLTTQWPWTR